MRTFGRAKRIMLNRAVRRGLVVGLYGSSAAVIVAQALGNARHMGWLSVTADVLFPLALLSYIILLTTAYGQLANEWKAAKLDERQREMRNRAYLAAYAVLAALVILVALYVRVAAAGSWWTPHTGEGWNAVLTVVMIVTTSLPAAVLAWLEPDPVVDA